MILALSVACSLAACGQKQETSKSDTGNTESTESTKKLVVDSSDKKTDSDSSKSNEEKSDTTEQSVEQSQQTEQKDTEQKKTKVQVFIDSDLEYVMNKLSESYESTHTDVDITYTVNSSVTLLAQIQGGNACDLYLSGVESQMESLRNGGLIVSNSYINVAGDTLAIITKKGSGTAVASIDDLTNAGSIAIAAGNLPVGVYTRRAMVVDGLIIETDDLSAITSSEISEQLNGVTIQEKNSASQIISAVIDGSSEIGCVLSSDICGYEDKLDVVQTLGNDYSGRIVYSLAQIKNDKASAEETEAATAFMEFVSSQSAVTIFSQCHFSPVQ